MPALLGGEVVALPLGHCNCKRTIAANFETGLKTIFWNTRHELGSGAETRRDTMSYAQHSGGKAQPQRPGAARPGSQQLKHNSPVPLLRAFLPPSLVHSPSSPSSSAAAILLSLLLPTYTRLSLSPFLPFPPPSSLFLLVPPVPCLYRRLRRRRWFRRSAFGRGRRV